MTDTTDAMVKQLVDVTPAPIMTPETKCSFCTRSLCCTYVTQEIDAPKSIKDYDLLLWQISHKNLQLYKDEGSWYLIINNSCQHLQDDGGCGIYETRPFICREHSNDYCEFDETPESSFDLFFPDYDSFDEHCRKRFKKWDKRFDSK